MESKTWTPINSSEIIGILRECGGEFAALAKRFDREPDGRRRLADRIRYDVQKQLTLIGEWSPKRRRKLV